MNIAVQFNRKYLLYITVMLKSLCMNNMEHIDLYVLNSALGETDYEKLKQYLNGYDLEIHDIKVDLNTFDNDLPQSETWPIEVYFKLCLVDLLPDSVDRILFLDADIIINGSLKELYSMDFEGKDMLVAPDANGMFSLRSINPKQYEMLSCKYGEDYVYFNSGMILMNIALLRGNNNFNSYEKAAKEWNNELCAPDQDLLNYVHGGNVGYVDWEKYNLCARIASHAMGMNYEYVKSNAIIIHYTGSKPWYSKSVLHFDIEKIWWDYAKRISAYEILASDFIESTLCDIEFINMINDTFEENKRLHELLDKCNALLARITS